ncbi:hypothetical protein GGR50DRAFT_687264 [Xylaria sp. CBS 124048]|nr:hypothetical protein GGR50DRAFT_687264 [Xylaria sp. CBS 124048]
MLGLPIHLDYAAHPFPMQAPGVPGQARGPAKPPHVPPKPARAGFTRDTGEDVVAICPSCDEELAYDPDGDNDAEATPSSKSRVKKATATAEHHFWAVKACGHVYCKKCYDHRRPTVKGPFTGFRFPEGNKKIFCAVEDCNSDVTQKAAWVGIFM